MEILRLITLNETEAQGCASAFTDSLFGELNAASMYLRKLEGQPKGSAFAYEMSLDRHRYGALMVLDRWAALARAFDPHVAMFRDAARSVRAAEDILGRANELIDATTEYGGDVVAACIAAFQSLNLTFETERKAVEQAEKLGPMLSEEYKRTRRIFLQDLAAR